jgi:hypothetical protein
VTAHAQRVCEPIAFGPCIGTNAQTHHDFGNAGLVSRQILRFQS